MSSFFSLVSHNRLDLRLCSRSQTRLGLEDRQLFFLFLVLDSLQTLQWIGQATDLLSNCGECNFGIGENDDIVDLQALFYRLVC